MGLDNQVARLTVKMINDPSTAITQGPPSHAKLAKLIVELIKRLKHKNYMLTYLTLCVAFFVAVGETEGLKTCGVKPTRNMKEIYLVAQYHHDI